MRILLSYIVIFTMLSLSTVQAQKAQRIYTNPNVVQGTFVKKTVPLRDFVEPPFDGVIVKENKEGYTLKDDWILNDSINPNAKPNGLDPAWQKEYPEPNSNKALNQSYNGIGFTNVNPPDPAMDVSNNHVIQMINGGGGALFQIWDRSSGNVVQNQTLFDSFTGVGGLGVRLYFMTRWLTDG